MSRRRSTSAQDKRTKCRPRRTKQSSSLPLSLSIRVGASKVSMSTTKVQWLWLSWPRTHANESAFFRRRSLRDARSSSNAVPRRRSQHISESLDTQAEDRSRGRLDDAAVATAPYLFETSHFSLWEVRVTSNKIDVRRQQNVQDGSEEIVKNKLAPLLCGDAEVVLQLCIQLGVLRDMR